MESSADDNFADLMRQVREGSPKAEAELIERFGPHILRVVRRKLNVRLRSKFDSDDYVQAVWLSAFADRSMLCGIERPQELAAYLMTLARNKVIDEVRRRLQTEKYDVRRERKLSDFAGRIDSPEKTPSQFAIAKEQWERILDGQPSHYERIFRLRADGATFREIADRLKINERTARRVVQAAAHRLDRE